MAVVEADEAASEFEAVVGRFWFVGVTSEVMTTTGGVSPGTVAEGVMVMMEVATSVTDGVADGAVMVSVVGSAGADAAGALEGAAAALDEGSGCAEEAAGAGVELGAGAWEEGAGADEASEGAADGTAASEEGAAAADDGAGADGAEDAAGTEDGVTEGAEGEAADGDGDGEAGKEADEAREESNVLAVPLLGLAMVSQLQGALDAGNARQRKEWVQLRPRRGKRR